ncbi:MauE/DoxX family redox-associated membrane protein [Actinomadura sp. NPDC047616]|uniref:MauE/DoxX family redox-associated membrane protein n=1 Tax=Actinomadura sp. NPDC047616 TaxID=3155914 RepID=UPI0033CC6C4C
MGYVAIGCQFLVGVVFAIAALSKIRDTDSFAAFADAVRKLNIVPGKWVTRIAVGTVAGEAVVPVALLAAVPARGIAGSGALSVAGLTVALLLLLGFIGIIATSMLRGVRVSCRCFGGGGAAMGWRHVARNTVLSLVALVALGAEATGSAHPVEVGGAALAAAMGCVLALMVAFLDDLVELFTVGPNVTAE